MSEASTITEAEILADAIVPDRADMPVEAARAVLDWKFSEAAARHMRTLLDRNNKGVLTPAQELELDRYRRVGMLLDLVQVKARVSLHRARSAS
ncbi:MAG: hypothetical protein KF777_15030 [Planctomycetaceae bacterium]|nr:hypothetical protein [Planctomycetaceae bacterium]